MPSETRMPDATTVGPVHLNVRDVDAQASFYADVRAGRSPAMSGTKLAAASIGSTT